MLWPCGCPSVRLSQVGALSKRLYISSRTQQGLSFSAANDSAEMAIGSAYHSITSSKLARASRSATSLGSVCDQDSVMEFGLDQLRTGLRSGSSRFELSRHVANFQLPHLHLTYPTCIWRLRWGDPVWVLPRFSASITRAPWLSHGVVCATLYVYSRFSRTSICDRRTDRHTTTANTRAS